MCAFNQFVHPLRMCLVHGSGTHSRVYDVLYWHSAFSTQALWIGCTCCVLLLLLRV